MRRVVGLETEYGLMARTRASGSGASGSEASGSGEWRRIPADEAGTLLFDPVARAWKTSNAFLTSGGRAYLDVGAHPEYATPECRSARDLVAAERAGDGLLVSLAGRAASDEAERGRETVFTLVKNNVDPWGNTYGSHENYQVPRSVDPAAFEGWLVPFLVARQLLVGAGRWRRGRFTLSQRCEALADVVSNQTTRTRPLINTRDEPHADAARWRRLHVISGDSNLVEPSAWLKVAATELVVRLAEQGRTPPLALADPLDALRRWGSDPDAAAEVQSGGGVTCRELLDRWHSAAGDVVEDADDAAAWNAWERTATAASGGRVGPDAPEWLHKLRMLEAWRDRHGAASDDARLDDLDVRWHVLGPGGVARLLEARGAFGRVTTEAEVAAARDEPPSPTRARVRSALLRAARENDRDHGVDWASFVVRDLAGPDGVRPREVALRLDDPLADHDAAADALVARMASEPRVRLLGGFLPPGRSVD